MSDAGHDVVLDIVTVTGERLGLHGGSVCFQPLCQVVRDGRDGPVDVFAAPGTDAGFVAGCLGGFLGVEAADPFGLARARRGVGYPDHVGPGVAAFHDAIAELGSVRALARLVAARLFSGCGGGHNAAVLSVSSRETYSSRAVSGMRRNPSMRMEAMAPLASSS